MAERAGSSASEVHTEKLLKLLRDAKDSVMSTYKYLLLVFIHLTERKLGEIV